MLKFKIFLDFDVFNLKFSPKIHTKNEKFQQYWKPTLVLKVKAIPNKHKHQNNHIMHKVLFIYLNKLVYYNISIILKCSSSLYIYLVLKYVYIYAIIFYHIRFSLPRIHILLLCLATIQLIIFLCTSIAIFSFTSPVIYLYMTL